MNDDDIKQTYRDIVGLIKDVEHIDNTERALDLGIEIVRHLPEPLEKEVSEKLRDIADCLNLLVKFVIAEARYTRIRKELHE